MTLVLVEVVKNLKSVVLTNDKRNHQTFTTRNISRRPVEDVGVLYIAKSNQTTAGRWNQT